MKGYDLLAEYLWPTPPPAVPVPEEVLMMEDVLTGMSAAPKAVEESTEGVDPTTAITSADAPSTTHHVEMETNTVPLSATDTDESFSELDVTPEPEAPSPAEFMLFLGDFVYADVPVWWGDTTEAYRRLYRRVYNSPRCDPPCWSLHRR
jgi:alkaline phosphatase D